MISLMYKINIISLSDSMIQNRDARPGENRDSNSRRIAEKDINDVEKRINSF